MEVTAEGSPILLAERRTLTFRDRKIVIGSTPLADQALDAVSWGTCGIFRESPQAKAHQLLADLNLDCDPGRHGHSRS
jgi:phage terminase large subunit GpA-like protein